MNHNDWGYAWVAIIVAFVVLRGLFRMLRGLTTGGGNSQMDRISAAAKRVLQDQQQQARTSVPVTQSKNAYGVASKANAPKAKSRPVRAAASTQKPRNASAALLPKNRTPAVVRTGILSAGKEPVIQRRR